jgi:hypothetical protein
MSRIEELAQAQLDAYNRADLDAFCACYHPQVRMLEGEEPGASGLAEFRERYAAMFERGGFGAKVPSRLVHGDHCVDEELWWRLDPETQELSEGRLLVRYLLVDDLIGVVQFLG